MKTYFYRNTAKYDDWKNVVYFDIETVDDFSDFTDEALDVYSRAKHVAIAVHKSIYSDKVPAYDMMKTYDDVIVCGYMFRTPVEIARIIIDFADACGVSNIAAHNGNRFDFIVFKHLENVEIQEKYDQYFLVRNKIKYRLIDTLKLANATGTPSLDEFAKTFTGLQKLTAGNFFDYMMHDAYILAMTGIKLGELGIQFTPTRTSRHYLALHMREKPVITKIYADNLSAFEYAGGRTQIFRYEVSGNIHTYDFNSLYPSVMANFLYAAVKERSDAYYIDVEPCDYSRYMNIVISLSNFMQSMISSPDIFISLRHMIPQMMPYILFSRVKITGIKPQYRHIVSVLSPFSFVNRAGKRVYHIVPGQIYTISGYEHMFLEFFEYELYEAYISRTSYLPFADMMKQLYDERMRLKKAGDVRQQLSKIVMNASYGVFGLRAQSRIKTIRIPVSTAYEILSDTSSYIVYEMQTEPVYARIYEPETNSYVTIYQIAYDECIVDIEYADQSLFSPNSSPPVAILTTSHARFWLYLHMLYIFLSGYSVYYCDTDSIHTNAPPDFMKIFISGDMLDLKHENSYSNALYLAPKTYILYDEAKTTTTIHMKGTGKDLEKTYIQQSLKTEYRTITKRFIAPDSIPAFYPAENIPVYNHQLIRIADIPEYMQLITKFENIYEMLSGRT